MAVTDDELDTIIGAFEPPDPALFRVLLEATARQLGGDLAEMGVLYGKSAVLLGDFLGPGETLTVVDLFEDEAGDSDNQRENDDSYPGLTQAAFESNYRRFHGALPTIVRGFSQTLGDHVPHGGHRLVHVDASHLHEHVALDIEVARQLLKPDGVLVLDDFREEHTPGVAAAAWQAVLTSGLKPFLVSPHKMYATWGDPAPWAQAVRGWAEAEGRWFETQVVNDAPLLRVTARHSDFGGGPHPFKRYVPEVLWPAANRLRSALSGLREKAPTG